MMEEFSTGRGFGKGRDLPLVMEEGKGQLLSLLARVGSDMGPQVASQVQPFNNQLGQCPGSAVSGICWEELRQGSHRYF